MKRLVVSVLLVSTLAACGAREEGMQLRLQLTHQPEHAAEVEGTTRSFTNSRGERITLTRAYVTVNSVEIFPCQTTSAWRRWMDWLSPIGTAHAHSHSSPLRMGEPHVDDLERPDGAAWELGTLQPPPGSYCRVRVVLGPADADAVGLPEGGAMTGKTLLLEGQVRSADGATSRDFHLESASVANAELPLEMLTLSPDAREASLLLTFAYDHWLEGVQWDSQETAAQALADVGGSIGLQRQP
jgi:hypothetical protein